MAKRNHQFSHAKKSKHSVLKIVLIVILVLVVAGGAYAFRLYAQARSAVDSTYHPVAGKKASKNIQNKKPLSILLLGTDTGAEGRIEKGNSDTMIVATVNNSKKQTNLVSIPRDTMLRSITKIAANLILKKLILPISKAVLRQLLIPCKI